MKPETTSSIGARGGEFVARREEARASVLRANRAVMGILVLVLLLGIAMVLASYRAHQHQRRAEVAEGQATERLWNSYLAQARAERLSTEAGHRVAALVAISNAAAIRPAPELRDEAIAALNSHDLVLEVRWPLQTNAYGFYFDPQLEHYVVRYAANELSMFRLADNSFVRKFRAADAGLGDDSIVKEFHFSLTGRYVTIQYTTGEIVLWEKDTGRAAHVFGGDAGGEPLAWRPTFTGDDRILFARSTTRPGRVIFVDLASGERRELEVRGVNETVRLNPTGAGFIWSRGNELFLHDATTGRLLKTIPWNAEVMSFRWDWKGEQLCVWCRDSSLNVWDLQMDRTRQFGGKLIGPWVQQFSPDGTMLVTAGHDGTSRLWDIGDARLLAQTKEARAFTFGRDGERIAFAIPGKEVGVWRISKPVGHRRLQGAVADTASAWFQDLSPDGRWLVWAPPGWVNRPGFEIFDLASGRPPLFVTNTHAMRPGFHPTEPKLVVASREGLRTFWLPKQNSGSERIRLDLAESIPLPEKFQPHIFSLNADGRFALVASRAGKLIVADLKQPGRFVELEGGLRNPDLPGPAGVTGSGALALSPDGRWVAAGRDAASGRPTIWDAQTGRIVRQLDSENAHLAFSPDSRLLAMVGFSACTVWDVASWQVKWRRDRPPMLNTLGAAAFMPDGSLMAFARGLEEVELVEPATGNHIATFAGPNIITIAGIRFSLDGRTLAVPASDGRIHVWDLSAVRERLATLGLDWGGRAEEKPAPNLVANKPSAMTPTLLGGLGLSAVGLVGMLGLVVLRRHGRFTDDFVRTTELAAQQARELAAERELNELKTRFVALVSHEFRTPLGITMSAVELLRNYADRLPPEKLKELLHDIYSSTLRMSGLMEQVLLLGRVEAGKIGFQSASIDLTNLGSKLVDETISATSRRCPVQFRTEGDLTDAHGDESLLRHIFSNLLSNAVKYSRDGGAVDFTVRRERDEAVFTVRDRGIGIPDADRARLFEAFHRAANVGQTPGTGLGLLIVKRCAELHQGTVSFESEENRGTTFTVRLPLFRLPTQ